MVAVESPEPVARQVEHPVVESQREPVFATFWEFAVAVNRADPAALALAGNGAISVFPVEGADVRKLLTTMWFRTVLARLSREWHERLLNALIEYVSVSDHPVKLGRQTACGAHLHTIAGDRLDDSVGCDSTRPDLLTRWAGSGSGCGEAVPLRRDDRTRPPSASRQSTELRERDVGSDAPLTVENPSTPQDVGAVRWAKHCHVDLAIAVKPQEPDIAIVTPLDR
jgi:hypothetical protein